MRGIVVMGFHRWLIARSIAKALSCPRFGVPYFDTRLLHIAGAGCCSERNVINAARRCFSASSVFHVELYPPVASAVSAAAASWIFASS